VRRTDVRLCANFEVVIDHDGTASMKRAGYF
jgi:hypothetical protein